MTRLGKALAIGAVLVMGSLTIGAPAQAARPVCVQSAEGAAPSCPPRCPPGQHYVAPWWTPWAGNGGGCRWN